MRVAFFIPLAMSLCVPAEAPEQSSEAETPTAVAQTERTGPPSTPSPPVRGGEAMGSEPEPRSAALESSPPAFEPRTGTRAPVAAESESAPPAQADPSATGADTASEPPEPAAAKPPRSAAGPAPTKPEPPTPTADPNSSPVSPQPAPASAEAKPKQEPALPSTPQDATASAKKSFQASQERVRALVRANASDAALEAEVDQFLDYRWLAEQSLGGRSGYADRCAPRCEDFEALLTQLIRRNYLSRVRQSERGSVSYSGEEYRQGGTLAKVDTRVDFRDKTGKDRSLDVDYVMHRRGSQWKVRDIYTDGVGLARTYRHDFKVVMDEGGIDRLVERLQAKLDELEA